MKRHTHKLHENKVIRVQDEHGNREKARESRRDIEINTFMADKTKKRQTEIQTNMETKL